MGGIVLLGRTIRVDHCNDYKTDKVKAGFEEEYIEKERIKRLNVLPNHLLPDNLKRELSDQDDEDEIGRKVDAKLEDIKRAIRDCKPDDPMKILLQDKLEKRRTKIEAKIMLKREKKLAKKHKKKRHE